MKNRMTDDGLPVHRVDVVEAGVGARRGWIACEIGENVKFDTAGLEAYCFGSWDPVIFDAFLVAAAVQFCDHTKRRPRGHWGRHFELRMPVHDVALWRSGAVRGQLEETLAFLTGDRWSFEFYARNKREPAPDQGRFSIPGGERVIVPFSDGLDSLAVARLMECEHQHKLIRVRLGERPMIRRKSAGHSVPFVAVPYRVKLGKTGSVESSARSRGLRFAMLTGVAAYLCRSGCVINTESGQGALGPVLVSVGQEYEDYRNHPLFTDRISQFLAGLFDHEVRYIYPRLWQTKAETLSEFVVLDSGGRGWAQTRSCWQSQRQVSVSGRRRQCGVCAACMLRRMSVHASGLEESKETYVWESLDAERFQDGAAVGFGNTRPEGALYEYAIAGTLHLDHLASLGQSQTNRTVLVRQASQLNRALGDSERDTSQRLDRLLMQHGNEWNAFLESLGSRSFVRRWALGDRRDVVG